MKKMSFVRIITLMILAAIVIVSCKKDDATNPQAEPTAELEFLIEQTDFGGFKSTNVEVPECADLSMDYVVFEFNGTEYTSPLFVVDGKILTKAVKLPVLAGNGTYPLTKFVVYSDVLPLGQGPEDIIVKAAPEPGSKFHDLMVNKLNIDIEVEAFRKKEVTIDVLCFEDLFYQDFGFTWFQMNTVKIERLCWFGDVCTGKLADFNVEGSYYALQSQGVQMDMPAVMKVKVYKKDGAGDWGTPIREFDNVLHVDGSGWYGEGACMEVYWANDEDVVEDFKFELYVHLPVGIGMGWVLVDEFEFQDENGPAAGTDGVVDFVLGNCQIDEADYQYPAWMDLPPQPFQMYVGTTYAPGVYGAYVDITLSGIGNGYDIGDGTYGVWCGDESAIITAGQTYTVNAISSLMPLPLNFTLTPTQLNILNYLFNNLPNHYPGIDLFDVKTWSENNPGKWEEIQHAIWAITDNLDVSGEGMAETVSNEAMTNGTLYKVLPGQWAAVLFWIDPTVQVLFVMVDP